MLRVNILTHKDALSVVEAIKEMRKCTINIPCIGQSKGPACCLGSQVKNSGGHVRLSNTILDQRGC